MTLDHLAMLLVALAAPPANLFPLLYALRSAWWTSTVGRALMVLGVGLAALVDLSLLFAWLGPDYPGRNVLRVGVYSLVVVGLWAVLGSLVQAQARARQDGRCRPCSRGLHDGCRRASGCECTVVDVEAGVPVLCPGLLREGS